MSDVYRDSEGRRRNDEAYDHVVRIAGDAIPVYVPRPVVHRPVTSPAAA
jgi:hypothetical protein